jgi:hypothetical protein
MSREKKQSVWPAILLIVIVYLIAAIVEPCDGHSCKGQTHEQR